jgi:hypothetical protein
LRDRVWEVIELTTELLSRVIPRNKGASGRPLDFERNNSGCRRAIVACDSVLDVPVIADVKIVHFNGCGASGQVDLDIFWVEDRRPEESILPDTRVEIMDLRTPKLGVIDVNSDQCENPFPDVAIPSLVNALEEGHVIAVRVQVFPDDACFPIGLRRRRVNKPNTRVALEIPNRGRIGIGPGLWWNLHVNVHAKDVQRVWDG